MTAEIVLPNLEAQALAYDFEILEQLATTLPAQSPLGNKARTVANDIMNAWRGQPEDITKAREMAKAVFGEELENIKTKQHGDAWAIGYCHIDTAWLWPWAR